MALNIIQSFWSKPFSEADLSLGLNRYSAGWYDIRFFYVSWYLSSLLLKRRYGKITLVTDELGKELLIEKMGLPYDIVLTDLNALNQFSSEIWSLGKIYAYSLQEKPFLHFDSDVFIWEKISKNLRRVFCVKIKKLIFLVTKNNSTL